MIKKKIKILLTCIGHVPKKLFLSELKKSFKYDYEIIGTDTNKKTKNSKYVDYFYKVPSGKNKNFNNAIYKICLKHKINIVLPAADEGLILEGGCTNTIPPDDLGWTHEPPGNWPLAQ